MSISWVKALSEGTATNDPYELWPPDYPPANIHDYIDQAMIEATGRVYDPVEDISLHADGVTTRLDIPTGVDMIREVQYRASITSKRVHLFGTTFDETTDTEWAQSVDTKDHRQGAAALKIAISTSAEVGDYVSDSLTAIDASGCTHVEGWIKSENALAAGDIVVHLDDGTVQADGSDIESLSVPAVSAETWTYFRVALANPWDDTAIASIGIEYNANIGLGTIWLDDIRAVNNNTAVWRTLPAHLWSIDKEARDLVLTDGGRRLAGYAPLKLLGGKKPALLSSDTDVTEISDQFITARATALALLSSPGSPESNQGSLAYWDTQARSAYGSLPLLTNARMVD